MIRAVLVLLALMQPAAASDLAEEAAAMLLDAADRLEAAETAEDRIAALTETVRAYETGLSAMRDGLRAAELEERALSEKLAGEDRELGALLALMQTATRQAAARAMVHPGSAVDTIRAGTLASALVPALDERAAALDGELTRLKELTALQRAGVERLEAGLAGIREARLALAGAVAERAGDLPPPVSTDDATIEALINSSDTLSGFADALLPDGAAGGGLSGASWPMPVAGEVIAGFGAGRSGWSVAVPAEALVTAPADATVRFAGDVPGQGVVTILEPVGGVLVILAGLGQGFVSRGQVVADGEPIGFIGKGGISAQEKLNGGDGKSSLAGNKTLYIEIRQGRAPMDPAEIFTQARE